MTFLTVPNYKKDISILISVAIMTKALSRLQIHIFKTDAVHDFVSHPFVLKLQETQVVLEIDR